MDEPATIETQRGRLVGMLHLPDAAAAGPGVAFCNPFGEERKSGALTMARLARAVAAAGFPALRFDYYGCGDSEGEFVEATVGSRMGDIEAAARFLRERAGCRKVCLLGLRLGGTLAARVAADAEDCAGLILIEPVPDGEAYFGVELRRSKVRQMITHGRAEAEAPVGPAAESDDPVLDLDGFAVRASVLRKLRGLAIRAGEVGFAGPVLVCQVHFREAAKPELEAVCAAYREAGAEVEFRRLVLPPFWNRIEVALAPELDGAVASWLRARFGA